MKTQPGRKRRLQAAAKSRLSRFPRKSRKLRTKKALKILHRPQRQGEDGSVLHAHMKSLRLPRTNGQESAGGAAVVGRAPTDLTQRHQAEMTLRESEAQLRLVLEHSNDAIFWADAETGLLVRCNRKAEELTGRTREELIGMHQAQLHPPDRDYGAAFRQAAASSRADNIEAEILSRTGNRTPVLINSSVVTFGGKKIIQGIFRDITERKRAEKVLRLALQESKRRNAELAALALQISRALQQLEASEERARLVGMIRDALSNEVRLKESQGEQEAMESHLQTLTVRERQVFDWVIKGLLNKQIAAELGASEQTIKVHRRRVMSKMKVASVAELVHVALKAGVLEV